MGSINYFRGTFKVPRYTGDKKNSFEGLLLNTEVLLKSNNNLTEYDQTTVVSPPNERLLICCSKFYF